MCLKRRFKCQLTLAPLQAPSKIGPESRTKVAGYRKYPKTVIFQEHLQPDSLYQHGSMQQPSTRDRPGAQQYLSRPPRWAPEDQAQKARWAAAGLEPR